MDRIGVYEESIGIKADGEEIQSAVEAGWFIFSTPDKKAKLRLIASLVA